MRSQLGIRIDASPARVFGLAADVERWPELLPHYRRVEVHVRRSTEILARMVAHRRLGPLSIPITWRALCWRDAQDSDDLRLHFRHVRGVTRGMEVTWHIRSDGGDGCFVTIEHEFRRPLPIVGPELLPRLIDRWFTTWIATRTLRAFRGIAERTTGLPPGRARSSGPMEHA